MDDESIRFKPIEVSDRNILDYSIQKRLKHDFSKLSKITDKWGYIRQIYMESIPEIMAMSQKRKRGKISPYMLDWDFSPIEEDAWQTIRGRGVPLYPQFPLFNYFIDFANPYLRIGVELDGKSWHSEGADRERDQVLAQYGWKIFRVKGSETQVKFRTLSDLDVQPIEGADREREIENWIMNTCDGVITAIDHVYFLDRPNQFSGLCLRSLDKHRLAEFELVDDQEDT